MSSFMCYNEEKEGNIMRWLIVNILLDIEDIFYKVFKIGKRR